MLLNCDLGEGLDNDAELFALIDQANIACGVHAGSPTIMRHSIVQAKQHGVTIGAHPGYPDREHFGRRSIPLDDEALRAWLLYQIGALQAMALAQGTTLHYVKPHGALYNDMMHDLHRFEIVVATLADLDANLSVMLQATPHNQSHVAIAERYGIEPIRELFADRHYAADGSLLPRSHPDALLRDPEAIARRTERYLRDGTWLSFDGKPLVVQAESLCIHGDHPDALRIAHRLRTSIEAAGA